MKMACDCVCAMTREGGGGEGEGRKKNKKPNTKIHIIPSSFNSSERERYSCFWKKKQFRAESVRTVSKYVRFKIKVCAEKSTCVKTSTLPPLKEKISFGDTLTPSCVRKHKPLQTKLHRTHAYASHTERLSLKVDQTYQGKKSSCWELHILVCARAYMHN